ncbi:hypothetical protein [Verminephrobacter aporrectodeae]|uniref:Toxin CptA n=1 Tax=Verminephrobacter aporrectodeae subsp. tuberculatae TaxID=1110392 RepID=A0ABT3KQ17_9BURK|nr:hypothetical protein [Verminephrobacter aporrectodeae]MCW5220612.1 hypothetical protein [Verminephrobacter aporrectodeae subsp. tuberculatae]MCW5255433.1 hypothetical protein [Verminephrobacter aporrectodeae subsp. tuberculatae]MCW5289907.1 hypothetical protein [Verminephrobacter aporrectodeae subsp. tuberculatae]MCW5320417.1 hypothetical protein [Verminephrobacter aporrectodeae subsp. tuberculatae]MCW8166298.1 hypothetical protein [Verminephrobacter aporrectodeae subsp. tuberculatae]
MTRLARRPPPVQYPLQRSAVLGRVLAFSLLTGAAVLAGWVLLGAGSSWGLTLAAGCLWLLAVAGAWHFWHDQFSGAMRWDGQAWALEELTPRGRSWPLEGPPEVLLDMQTQLWVCVSPVGRSRIWLWLERSWQPERWMDLRRAVYSRASPDAGNADETAAAGSRVGRES